MIDPKELQIGNWVYDHDRALLDESDGYRKVTHVGPEMIHHSQIYSTDIGDVIGHSGNKPENLDPISLTEEWLLKFGFEKKSLDSYEIGWDTLRLDPNDMGSYDAKEPGDFNPICNLPIQYVHQLQNLYFAIEGKELEIKEPAKV